MVFQWKSSDFKTVHFHLDQNSGFSKDIKSLRKFYRFGLPITDHELPSSFTTNIRVVGLTNNFQLVRTFTFFFTIFNSNIRFYHFYEIDYRTRFLKFQATVNSFLLASQKPTNKFNWDYKQLQAVMQTGIHALEPVGPKPVRARTRKFWNFRTRILFEHLTWISKFSSIIWKFLHKTFSYATNLTEYTVRTLSIYTGG